MKVKKFLLSLISSILLLLTVSFPVYASDVSSGTFKIIVDHNNDNGSLRYQAAGLSYSSKPGALYFYFIPSEDGKYYSAYIVSDSGFSLTFCNSGLYTKKPDFSSIDTKKIVGKVNLLNGYYVSSAFSFYRFTSDEYSFDGDLLPIIYWSTSELPWEKDGFELGKDDSGGGTTSSIVYDSSIPAPQDVKFKSESVGGFLGVGSKWEHTLSWSNGLASPPLFLRVYSVAEVVFADTGQFFEDSTIPLLSADDKYNASSGRYSVGTDELSSKIMDGTVLNKVLEYRLQFCRYGDDGNLKVGPIATVHVKQNLFGKYDGYTVTTEYPKDDTDLGLSGGLDDEYKDKWTSDGEHYDDYDKDGNLVDSGTSEDSNPIQKLLNSLKNIPNIVNSFFDSLMGLMSGVGQIPSFLSQLFSFLPPDIITVIGLGILLVIVLRIFGR